MIKGNSYDGIVLYCKYTVTLGFYHASFDMHTGIMLTNGYTFCNLPDGSCNTGESMVIYDATPENCQLCLLKSTAFIEFTGHRWNFLQITDIKPGVSKINTIDMPTVLMMDGVREIMHFV